MYYMILQKNICSNSDNKSIGLSSYLNELVA